MPVGINPASFAINLFPHSYKEEYIASLNSANKS